MKKLLAVCAAVLVFCACTKAEQPGTPSVGSGTQGASTGAEDAQTSYAFGMIMATDFADVNMHFDYEAFINGFRDQLEGRALTMTFDDALTRAQDAYTTAVSVKNEELKLPGIAFLAENSTKPGIVVTASGLQYEVITEGTGAKPLASDTVRVHYQGTLIDGTVFDSSYERDEPVEFPLTGIIPGWTEGLQLMSVGSTYQLYIPSELGYGDRGAGAIIPPNAVLVFKVELLSIVQEAPVGQQ